MQELEEKTYNFTIQGIGLLKSLEKYFPEKVSPELSINIGNVSLKFIKAINAQENEDFSKNLRECHSSANNSKELLNIIGILNNESFEKLRNELISELKDICERLDKVIEKLIY